MDIKKGGTETRREEGEGGRRKKEAEDGEGEKRR